jgi:hypothetical protein
VAALRAILRALRRAVSRDLMTLWSIKVNNFFLFVLLLVYGAMESGVEPKAAEPLLLLLGILVLLPASSDPLAKIPPSRLALWPLRTTQRVSLRFGSLLLSPVLWLTFALLWKTSRVSTALGFVAFAIGLQVVMSVSAGLARSTPFWNPLRYSPQFPGRLGGLIRNNLREMLTLLDFYVALMLSVGGSYYAHFTSNPDPSAPGVISVLIALALSTFAQSVFGLELGRGMTRYHLLPLRGWEILLAKDVAFLALLVALLAPLSIGPGLTFGLAALALGHHSSLYQRIVLKRWRFAGGRLLPVGAAQAVGGFGLGFAETQFGATVLLPVAALWVISIYSYGRCWEKQ